MTNLTQAIRSKRFRVKEEAQVDLIVSTKIGTTLKMRLENCSLGGIGALLPGDLPTQVGLELGDIQPAARLSWRDQELTLGRLVLRSCRKQPGSTFLGFSLVDTKLPVDGSISRELEIGTEKNINPFEFELSPNKFNLASFDTMDQSNVDIFGKCHQFAVLHNEWTKTPKFQYRTIRDASKGTRVKLRRRRKTGRNDYLVMGSNDYWGLAAHPRVIEAAKKALDEYGFGSTGSPVTTGTSALHEDLCNLLAKMFQKDRCILFNSGFAANVGALTALAGDKDLIVADILSHSSIQSGIDMARGQSRYFKHNDPAHLDRILTSERNKAAGCMIVTEGAFSMDGDIAPIDQIVARAKEFNCRVFVDEAHSFGILGPTGLGACEHFDAIKETDLIMGTFSKICGGIGGFVVGDEEVIDWLYYYSKPHMFSVSLPPSNVAAVLEALRIFKEDHDGLRDLKDNIRHFVSGLRSIGYPIDASHQTPIVPVVIGDEEKLGMVHQRMMDAGIYTIPIVYPAVSRTSCRFRFTIMRQHTISDLDYVLTVLDSAVREAGVTFNQKPELTVVGRVDDAA